MENYTQSRVSERWNEYLLVQKCLQLYSRKASLEDLRSVIRVAGELGEGVYGVVYEAFVKYGGVDLPLAVKSVSTLDRPKDREHIFTRMLREEMAYAYLNALVFLKTCPNFILVHKSFLSRHKKRNDMYCFLMSMEKAQGTLRQWICEKYVEEPHQFMYCVLQVLIALVTLARHLHLVHNDLYLKNILYNKITPTQIYYKLGDKTYKIQANYLFKLSDFGICSSPTYLTNEHEDMNHMTSKKRPSSDVCNFDFSNHILEYPNIPSYTRDVAVFLRSLTAVSSLHTSCKIWLDYSLRYLAKCMPNNPLKLEQFVHVILSENTLRSCNLSPSMFKVSLEDPSCEVFNVYGDADTNRAMKFMAKDYLNTGQKNVAPETLATPSTKSIF